MGGGVNFPHQIAAGEDIVIKPFIQGTGSPIGVTPLSRVTRSETSVVLLSRR